MENALVSIIIPIYNVSAYIDVCVQSACSQTYKNLEIILVDDGSPDDCPAKCDEWAKRDCRIKVIHKKNGGLSDARNAGLDAAKGRYVYFLDGDDYIKPVLIETAVAHMVEYEVDMVTFNFEKINPNGVVTGGSNYEYGKFDLSETDVRVEFIIRKLLCCKIGWEAWSRLYDRELIERYHLRFADNRKIFAEDLYFCLCYCAHAKNIMSIGSRLYCYLQREDSIMGQDSGKLNIGRMNELAKAVYNHFKRWDDCKNLLNCFSAIHQLIIQNVFSKALHRNTLHPSQFRGCILADIEDFDFFKSQVSRLGHCRNLLSWNYSGSQVEEIISYMQYLVDGNFNAFRIRNRLIYKFAYILDQRTMPMRQMKAHYKQIHKQSKRVFLLGTEEFGNVGDSQINESVVSFLRQTLPAHQIYEITAREWKTHKVFLENVIQPKDLIVFAGGGNFGDTYPFAHHIRAEAIRLWPQNPKIVFPQTIYFSDSETGRECLAESKQLYSKENNVYLFTREGVSFQLAQEHFTCNSYLVPDIVLSAQIRQGAERKQQALLCLRRDIEKALPKEAESEIVRFCSARAIELVYTDLQLEYNVDRSMRKKIIEKKFEQWCDARVVITDRLHGMVFAAITGTPCVVFSNFNHKIYGTYEWIRYLPYIRYTEKVEDTERYLLELLEMEDCKFDNIPLLPHFDQLAQVVKNCAKN